MAALTALAVSGFDAAAQSQGQGAGKGQGQSMQGGGHGQSTDSERGGMGGKGLRGVLRGDDAAGEEEDSDRPAWAGGNPELNPHAKAGGGKPAGAGTMKGDIYGDIVVLLRDPATGEPIVAGTSVDPETGEEYTEYYVCLDAACTETESTLYGEIPEGVDAIEVEFGRSSVARSPDAVTDKALDEALAKLEQVDPDDPNDSISLDPAGRIEITIDGETSTIDSPLENLALYVDLAIGLASDSTTHTEAKLAEYDLATLDTAASLLAGLADKTGDITLDYLVNENVIAGVVEAGEYYDYSDFTYDRDYPTDYSYWVSIDGATPVSRTLDINAYLEAVNGSLPDDDAYAALFAAAADDALEVIELVHTQIYTEILPGTVDAGG